MSRNLVRMMILAILAAPILGAAVSFSEDPDCPVKLTGFEHNVSWNNTGSRLHIEADSACGGRYGRPLELHNVRLSIERAGKPLAKLESMSGTLSLAQNRFLLGPAQGPTETGVLENAPLLYVELADGIVRSPGFYMDLGKNRR